MADILDWAKTLRKLMELQAVEYAKTADDKDVVELAVAFPYYKQSGIHKVGDIARDPETEVLKKCQVEYDGDVQTDWNISVGTVWYAYHGVSVATAYPYVAPTGGHDIYKAGEYMTFTDGKVYKAIEDTDRSPAETPNKWEEVLA